VKLSPFAGYNDMKDSDPVSTFSYVVKALGPIGFVEVCELFTFDHTNAEVAAAFFADKDHKNIRAYLKPLFSGLAYVVNGGYNQAQANEVISNGEADLASFGIHYLTNSDLPEKFASGATLDGLHNLKDMSKLWTHYFYGKTGEGYTDLSVY